MRHWFITILVVFALGAATNVLVAWIGFVHAQSKPGLGSGPPSVYYQTDEFSLVALHRSKLMTEAIGGIRFFPHGPVNLRPNMPHWFPVNFKSILRQPEFDGVATHYFVYSVGFPIRCFSGYLMTARLCCDELGEIITQEWRDGLVKVPISKIPGARRSVQTHAEFPISPVWIPFLANTGIYSAAWCMVMLAPGALRRHIRKRRGHCPACGYNRAGLTTEPCPECGKHPVKLSHA